ncbi:unnamed protein product [Rotaria socialis]|nr:unnamed protein product [Rotaria socialis]
MTLSVDKRYEIIFLSHHPMGPQLGVKAVAKAIKCAKSTIQYWLNRWKESKDLSDSKRIGRPRSTTKKETIRRRLKEYGAKFSLPISKPLLTEKHRQKRLEWAHAAGDIDWNRIIFSDETTVRLNQLKRCVWNLPGKRKVFRTVKYPIKVNIWGCFSCNGFGRIYCFRENLKADLLCRIYKRYLFPTARDHFGRNSTNWALQEDNDPKHTSQLAKQWRSKYEVQRIDWPSMSPDLNPIENVWKLLKMNLARKNLRTYKSLVSAIKKEWKAFPKDLTTNLVQNLYAMLPQDESLDVLTEFLTQHGYYKVQNIPIDAIRKLARIGIKENVFTYENRFYRQIIGGAMGSAFTLTLANIFMWKWEIELVKRFKSTNEIYVRYIDDIFFTSNESYQSIDKMLDEANLFHPNIKLVRQISRNVSFLDIYIQSRKGNLITSVDHKSTAEPYIVPFNSDHPTHILKNIINNALLRAVRYCTNFSDFCDECRTIKLMLLYNGYDKKITLANTLKSTYPRYPPSFIYHQLHSFFKFSAAPECIQPTLIKEVEFPHIRNIVLHQATSATARDISTKASLSMQNQN